MMAPSKNVGCRSSRGNTEKKNQPDKQTWKLRRHVLTCLRVDDCSEQQHEFYPNVIHYFDADSGRLLFLLDIHRMLEPTALDWIGRCFRIDLVFVGTGFVLRQVGCYARCAGVVKECPKKDSFPAEMGLDNDSESETRKIDQHASVFFFLRWITRWRAGGWLVHVPTVNGR